METGPAEEPTNYTPYLVGAIVLAMIGILIMRSQNPKAPGTKARPEEKDLEQDDELESLERGDR